MQIANCTTTAAMVPEIANYQRSDRARTRNSYPTSDLRPLTSRRGFTLVELLIVILIISILAALVLGVAAVAGETARQSQSRQIVERLHTLLMEHYDSYKTRRVKLRPQIEQGINNDKSLSNAAARGNATALARLYALRELVMMEVPDRWSDILLTDVPANPASGVTNGVVSYVKYPYFNDTQGLNNGRTELANVFLRRYASIAARTNTITGLPNTAQDITDNQGAECLYMIVTLACGDGEARSMFADKNIGDTDGDGAPEFLDGWGHPINFLRWAPGFDSQIQINANQFLPLPVSSAWKDAARIDHDPFDVFRVDEPAFRLVPLVFSGGRDETFGIRLVKQYVVMQGLQQTALNVVPNNTTKWPAILPWAPVQDTAAKDTTFLGTDSGEEASKDNVHNHLLGLR
jgi:prepilin-type N-terminal cleavage/methylation domain-containing protein